MNAPLIEAVNVKKYFKTPRGLLHAVEDVNFKIFEGKTLGVVGESGCGKSTLGRTILRLHEATAGQVLYNGENILEYKKKEMHKVQRNMQMVFQDPYSSLDPRMSVRALIMEPLDVVGTGENLSKSGKREKADRIMELCGLPANHANLYPHELDGGLRQRVGLARAMILEPKFLVCDEPVSALDVSIQAQILNLLGELQEKLDLTYIFITHDLSVVNHFSDDIAVMYLGQIVEKAPAEELFENPIHPYTQALLSAIPIPELGHKRERVKLVGEITSPIEPPEECRFAKRCLYCDKSVCMSSVPKLIEVKPNHFVACPLKQKEMGFEV